MSHLIKKIWITVDTEDYHWQFYRRNSNKEGKLNDCFFNDVDKILTFFSQNDIKATFFAAGYVAQKSPHLLKKIHALGHEIACHGLFHDLIFHQSENEFREELRVAKDSIEQAIGENIHGFRAPAFSISKKTPWFFEALISNQFRYDSSMRINSLAHFDLTCPIKINIDGKIIWEFPLRSIGFGFKRLTIIGGSYFRLLPAWLISMMITGSLKRRFIPLVYVHPYDFQCPPINLEMNHLLITDRIKAIPGDMLRRYGRKNALRKMESLLNHFESFGQTLGSILPANSSQRCFSVSDVISKI